MHTEHDIETSVCHFETPWGSQYLEDSMDEWLSHLKKQNEEGIKSASYCPENLIISTPEISSIVNAWCAELSQPQSVKVRTLEIYENFLTAHCKQLHKSLADSASENKKMWREKLAKTKHQSLLRLMSCFQIASKVEGQQQVVKISEANALLSQALRPCDASTILRSELQVLMTLEFNVGIPPTTEYVETLCCHLVVRNRMRKEASRLPTHFFSELNAIGKILLDLVYCDRRAFFKQIAGSISEPGVASTHQTMDPNPNYVTFDQKGDIRRLLFDKLLLAAAILSAASYIVDPESTSSIMRYIHGAANIHPSDMALISSVILSLLEPDNTSPPPQKCRVEQPIPNVRK